MSNSFRGFIIICIIGFTYYLLHPSIIYYFFYNDTIRKISETEIAFRSDTEYSEEELTLALEADKYREKSIKLGLDLKGGLNIFIEADFDKLAELTARNANQITTEERTEGIDRIINQLNNRLDTLGVSEVVIRKLENYRINIQLPGETSSKRIEDIVSTTGNLEFKIVDEENTDLIDYDTETKKINNIDEFTNYDISFLYVKDILGKRKESYPLAMIKEPLLDGSVVTTAQQIFGQYGEPVVTFQLDGNGTPAFAEITRTNQGKRLAIVLDGQVMSAPNINQPIPGGRGEISGSFTVEEAKDLALILKSGSLPVPIKIISKELIGPKIGEDLRQKGVNSLTLGLVLIFLFLLIRYRASGIIASTAMLFNGFIVVAFLSSFGLTISLPGLAGLLLTAGMAVDANVIINERIKDELKKGKSLVEAINIGYDKAFWTIFDANTTTLISTFVLFYYGFGFIQGFATTLLVGIIVSMFTSLFCTRFVYNVLLAKSKKYSKLHKIFI